MATATSKIHTAPQMCHIAIEAQEFIAPAQALALRIDEQQNWPARMVDHRVQNKLGLRQCRFHADGRMVGGPYDCDGQLGLQLSGPVDHIPCAGNGV